MTDPRNRFRLRPLGSPYFKPRHGPAGFAEFAGWLASDVLWIDGWLAPPLVGERLPVSIKIGGGREQVQGWCFGYERDDVADIPGATGLVLVLPAEALQGSAMLSDSVGLELDGCWYRWLGSRELPIHQDLLQRLPAITASLRQAECYALLRFLLDDCLELESIEQQNDPTLLRNLACFRELGVSANLGLFPVHVSGEHAPLGLSIERVIKVDDRSIFSVGWLLDIESSCERFDFVPLMGARLDILDRLTRIDRPDVEDAHRAHYGDRATGKHGFLVFLETDHAVAERDGFTFELLSSTGQSMQAGSPPPITDPFAGREMLLRFLPEWHAVGDALVEQQIYPAMERLQSRCRQQVGTARSYVLGSPAASPAVSLIVPVCRRFDLIEFQLASLADDPALQESEIIYVLDEPTLEPAVEQSLLHLARLYQVSLQIVVASHAAGYATAVNLGASRARGRLLLLLHDDVICEGPGWITTMAEYYQSTKGVGAVGGKLLYEDGAIQHAGYSLTRQRRIDGLLTVHDPYKGLPRGLPAAQVARTVPAVSGACCMIDRQLFEQLDGLRDAFVAGDYEDVDLALRCSEQGRQPWYLPEVELYHLERQTRLPAPGWNRNAYSDLYNRWLLSRLWGDAVPDVPTPED